MHADAQDANEKGTNRLQFVFTDLPDPSKKAPMLCTKIQRTACIMSPIFALAEETA